MEKIGFYTTDNEPYKVYCRTPYFGFQRIPHFEPRSRKPRLLDCKTEGWMTKALMEPEIKEMQDPRWQQEGNALH